MRRKKSRIIRLTRPVAAIMAGKAGIIDQAAQWLAQEIGAADLESETFAFDFTDYYRREMGGGLLKRFVSFNVLLEPEHLAGLKRRCAAFERRCADSAGNRTVNLDPGYWSDAKLVLASTKNYSHRIAIGRRVYAEVTLRYQQGRLQWFEWTYPDYKTPLALDFFGRVRRRYLDQLNSG